MTLSPSLSDPEEDAAACEGCPRVDTLDVMWCPAWQKYLCHVCRSVAADSDYRMTLEQQRALDAQAREAS